MPLVRIDLPQSIGAEQRASIGEIVGGPGMEQGVWHIIALGGSGVVAVIDVVAVAAQGNPTPR